MLDWKTVSLLNTDKVRILGAESQAISTHQKWRSSTTVFAKSHWHLHKTLPLSLFNPPLEYIICDGEISQQMQLCIVWKEEADILFNENVS